MADENAVYAKCAWRLIPFMMLLYVVNYLDRVNVGFAALTMNKDLGFSPSVFGFGAGIFFLSYALCPGARQRDSGARRRQARGVLHHGGVGASFRLDRVRA